MISTSTKILTAAAFSITSLVSGASERLEDGKDTYQAICARCHESGELDAPITGNEEDWAGRSHLWEAVLFEHADKGYINMPARGDSSYATQYDVQTAAEYMLTITHPDLPRD